MTSLSAFTLLQLLYVPSLPVSGPSSCDLCGVNVPSLLWYSTIVISKSDCLGCAVLLCLVVSLTLLASFFLPSYLSLKHVPGAPTIHHAGMQEVLHVM